MENIVYVPDTTPNQKSPSGLERILLQKWGDQKITARTHQVDKELEIRTVIPVGHEAIIVVEGGVGSARMGGKYSPFVRGSALKVYPGQEIVLEADEPLSLFVVSMARQVESYREDASELHVVDMNVVPQKVYEYEALAQEIFTPPYEPSLGLLTFTFPIKEIPFHIHPYSDRIIRPMWNSEPGWTYAEPNVYEMGPGSMCAFKRGTTHTNGPVAGEIYTLLAFQIPYVTSQIDEENIAGAPRFVQYVGETPPKQLWKNKADFERVLARLRR